jgi:hypothetical protein
MRYSILVCSLLCLASASLAARESKPSLEAAPEKVKLRLGEGTQLKARLKGREGTVKWAVEGPGGGTVTPAGFYQAPSEAVTPATVRVTATSDGEPPLTASTLVFLEPVAVSVKSSTNSLSTADTCQLSARVEGVDDQRVRWSVDGGAGNGQVTAGGLYASPPRFLTPGTVTVRATSLADSSKSATATLQIEEIGIRASPAEVAATLGRTVKLEAKVTGTSNAAVEWKVQGENQGEVSSTGLYSTPAVMTTPTLVTVIASSVADPTKTATVRVRVQAVGITAGLPKKTNAAAGLAHQAGDMIRTTIRTVTKIYLPFNPVDAIVQGPLFRGKSGIQYVPLGGSTALIASVSNSANGHVTWSMEGPAIGTLGEGGVYQAPEKLTTPQVVQLRATCVADPTKSAVYALHIAPVLVEAEDDAVECGIAGVVQLGAAVRNSENARLTWSVDGGPQFGTVSESGLYHPPASIATPATVRVRATSVADPTKSAAIQVTIPEVRLDVEPTSAELKPGQTVRLKPRIKGLVAAGEVTWKLTPEVGTITPDGVYQAPVTGGPQVVQVVAALKADPTKTAVVRLKLRGE